MSNMEKMPDSHDGITEINSFAEAMRDVEPFKAPEPTQGEVGEKDQNLEKTRRIFIEKYAAKVLERNIDSRERHSVSEEEIESLIKKDTTSGNPDDVVFKNAKDAVDSYKVALLCLAGSEDVLKRVDKEKFEELEEKIRKANPLHVETIGYKEELDPSSYYTRYLYEKSGSDQKTRRLLRYGSEIIKAAIPGVIEKRVNEPRRSLEDKFESIEKTFK